MTTPSDPNAAPFLQAAQDASGSNVSNTGMLHGVGFGRVVMAPATTGPGVTLQGLSGLGVLSPAGSGYLSLLGATAVGAGVGFAASRGSWRGAGIGAGLQLALASALTIGTTRGIVSKPTHVVQGLLGLSGLIGAGILLARKRG